MSVWCAACGGGASGSNGQTTSQAAVPKKMVEMGWDRPTPDFVRQNIAIMEQRPFDGLVVRLPVGYAVLKHAAYPGSAFTQDQLDLAATKFTKLTENFVIMWSTPEDGWDWFSDSDWASAEQNIRNFARTARAGGFKGIFFDTEPYGNNAWSYLSQPGRSAKSFAQYQAQVRLRGAQFMRAIQEELPGATLFLTWGFAYVQRHAPLDTVQRQSYLQTFPYGLLPVFLAGVFDAIGPTGQVIDGNEDSYFYLSSGTFDSNRQDFKLTVPVEIDPTNQNKFQTQYSYGNAVFVDGIMNLWNSARFFGYFLSSDDERLKLLEHNIYHALRTSDQFAWVYSNNMDWWKGQIPANVEDTVRRAKIKVDNSQPLGFGVDQFVAQAKVKFDARVAILGNIHKNGLGVQGVTMPGFQNSCPTSSPSGDYQCVFPSGWSGTLAPSLTGSSFNPANRSYSNVTTSQKGQDFVVAP